LESTETKNPDQAQDRSLIDMIRDRLADDEMELSTIPLVAQEILSTLQDPNCSLQELESRVRKDQVVASKIIRMSNSSFYGGLKEIESLPDAIMRLGFKGVQSIALAVAMKNVYQGEVPRYVNEMQRLWRHSMASAIVCREMALSSRCARDEEAFLGGLVHDIGTVFIVDSLDRLARNDKRIAELQEEIFQEILQALHEESGAYLLEKWTFPKSIIDSVRCHHEPSKAPEGNRLAWLFNASDSIVEKMGLDGSKANPDIPLSNLPAVQQLRLGDLEIAKVLVDIEDKVQEMLSLV
jgi:HD-like signal output (HDOD) protein